MYRNRVFEKSHFWKLPRTRLYIRLPLIIKTFFKAIVADLNNEEQTLNFEKKFASCLNLPYALAMPYARIALFYILKALELPSGSEVLLTPITIADIVNVIHLAGLKPVFIDIELETFNLDPDEIDRNVTENSKVLLVTHLFGITPDMDNIVKTARKYNLIIIEDISQSFGCMYKKKYLGTFGKVGFCSLSWIKNLTTFYGGMIVTEDKTLLAKIKNLSQNLTSSSRGFFLSIISKSLIVSIMTQKYIFSIFTYYILKVAKKVFPRLMIKVMSTNEKPSLRSTLPVEWFYKFNDLQAWLGLEVLKTIRVNNEKRIENVKTLFRNLSSASRVHIPKRIENAYNVYWRLPFLLEDITNFQEYLFKNKIDNCGTILYVCSNLKMFSKFKKEMPRAGYLKKNMTFIPVHPTLNEFEMKYIADVINSYFVS